MLGLIFFRTAISLTLFGSMFIFVDLFQSHRIDVQAGEQKLLALAYSALFCLHSNGMVATSTSSRHARTPCRDNYTIRISYNPQSFSLWILMDPWTLQNKAIFVPSFILLTRISPTKPLSK